MKIATTGAKGNIGHALVERGVSPLDCNITDIDSIRKAISDVLPDIIINPASKSLPDWCETHTEYAILVNLRGANNLALITEELQIPMIALSTDHVFNGRGCYKESSTKLFPVNFYGQTKLAMECLMDGFDNVKIIRTSNCFWKSDPRVIWYVGQLYTSDEVFVPTFQKRSFMFMGHFCDSLEYYLRNFDRMPKILHISGSKCVSWYTFVKAFVEALGISGVKFRKQWFDNKKHIAARPKIAGLNVGLSAKLGLPQFDYIQGLKEMTNT